MYQGLIKTQAAVVGPQNLMLWRYASSDTREQNEKESSWAQWTMLFCYYWL